MTTEDPIRYSIAVVIAAAVLANAACAGPSAPGPTASASAASPARPGERHLRNIRQLTFGGNNAEAYFSRSGRQLIFQRQEKVDSACDQQYVMNIDGSELRRVSNGYGRTTCGYFYDHDRRILYSSTHEFSRDCPAPVDRSRGYLWALGHFEIYSQKLDGTDQHKLTNNGAYNAESTVSPNGSRIVFTGTKDGDLELYTMNVDGSDVRRVTNRVGYDGGAFFSPDGRHLVWRAQYPVTAADTADYRRLLADRLVRPAKLEIWIGDADGSNARKITALGGANFAPFFHPDGKRIIFASNYLDPRGPNFDLFLVNTDGSGLQQITTDKQFDGFPMFSPDGRKLVWASNREDKGNGETDLFIADWVE